MTPLYVAALFFQNQSCPESPLWRWCVCVCAWMHMEAHTRVCTWVHTKSREESLPIDCCFALEPHLANRLTSSVLHLIRKDGDISVTVLQHDALSSCPPEKHHVLTLKDHSTRVKNVKRPADKVEFHAAGLDRIHRLRPRPQGPLLTPSQLLEACASSQAPGRGCPVSRPVGPSDGWTDGRKGERQENGRRHHGDRDWPSCLNTAGEAQSPGQRGRVWA